MTELLMRDWCEYAPSLNQPKVEPHPCEAVRGMRQEIVDNSAYAQAADLIARMMEEFWDDGEQFNPSSDEALRTFIVDVARREVPGLDDEELSYLMAHVNDFLPPVQE